MKVPVVIRRYHCAVSEYGSCVSRCVASMSKAPRLLPVSLRPNGHYTMTKHSKNNTASSIFSYAEYKKLDYGTKRVRRRPFPLCRARCPPTCATSRAATSRERVHAPLRRVCALPAARARSRRVSERPPLLQRMRPNRLGCVYYVRSWRVRSPGIRLLTPGYVGWDSNANQRHQAAESQIRSPKERSRGRETEGEDCGAREGASRL